MVGVAQVVRAPGCGPGGRGFKSPRSPLWFETAPVAQLAEQGTLNPKVEGSIPSGRTVEMSFCHSGFLGLDRADLSG